MNPSFVESPWPRDVIAGTAVQCLPPQHGDLGLVLILPDADWPTSAALTVLTNELQACRLSAVMPEARTWWVDRPDPASPESLSPLRSLGESLVPAIMARWPAISRVAAFGVGIGGQGALQLAYRVPQLVPIAAAVSPTIDFHRLFRTTPDLQEWFHSEEQARQETATLRLHPLNWPPHQWFCCAQSDWRFDGCERLASKLTSIGIPFEADLKTSGEDVESYRDQQLSHALKFIAAKLSEPIPTREIRMGRST